jgi:predicted DNA-binding transcriptional regulator YafY
MSGARATAGEQLERLLYLIPRAARDGGCRLGELAATLGITVEQVSADLVELTDRAFYLPAGSGDDLQILIEGDHVRIWTTKELRRPARLSPLEALALALGLRILAAEEEPARRQALRAHAERLERQFATGPVDELLARFAVDSGERGESGVQATLRAAARERRRCRIEYLKAGAEQPEERVLSPYALIRNADAWYLLAHCAARQEVRAFRVDRTLSATLLPESFEVPADFDPESWLAGGGQLFRAEADLEVQVRYSPGIARWLREKGPVEEQEDGSVVIRHRVADPRWLVRHILQYGAEAEVLRPAEMRQLVAAAARRVTG